MSYQATSMEINEKKKNLYEGNNTAERMMRKPAAALWWPEEEMQFLSKC